MEGQYDVIFMGTIKNLSFKKCCCMEGVSELDKGEGRNKKKMKGRKVTERSENLHKKKIRSPLRLQKDIQTQILKR